MTSKGTRAGGDRKLGAELSKLLTEHGSPGQIADLLEGLARLRESRRDAERANHVRLVALRWLIERIAAGDVFPSRNLGCIRDALLRLFDYKAVADDAMKVVASRTADQPAAKRLRSSEACLQGHMNGRSLEEMTELLRCVMRFPVDTRPICVLSGTMSRPKAKALPLTVAEGELLTIGGIISLLEHAYPDRHVYPLLAASRCHAWSRLVKDADTVCIGAHNSNVATKRLLKAMRPNDRPTAWIKRDGSTGKHFIPTSEGRIQSVVDRRRNQCRDGAVVHVRGHHTLGKGGMVCFLAGIETYGTAMAAAAMTDPDFLYHMASESAGGASATYVLEGRTSGLTDIWPIRFRAVLPSPWPGTP